MKGGFIDDKMQANQSAVIWTVVIAALVLLVAGFLAVGNINKNQPEPADVPTAAEIASLISVPAAPEAPVVDTSVQDRICELTDGCKYWESRLPGMWTRQVMDEEDDIEDALLDLLNLDKDDLEKINIHYGDYDVFKVNDKETQVRLYAEDYEVDGDWEAKIFARVTYKDVDEDNDDHEYVLITSTFDEGEYDSLTVESVPRSFEF